MAWLEKHTGPIVELRVVEARGKSVWERRRRARNRGRMVILGEHDSHAAAERACRARKAELLSEGYAMIDARASVDAKRPSGRAATVDSRLRPDDVERELRTRMPAESASLADMLVAFETVMKMPRAYRSKGHRCDLDLTVGAPCCVLLPSDDGFWRELGYEVAFDAPSDRETWSKDIGGECTSIDICDRDID